MSPGIIVAICVGSFMAVSVLGVLLYFLVNDLITLSIKKTLNKQWDEWLEANPDCAKAIKEYNINIKI